MMNLVVSSHESSRLASCRLLLCNISVHGCLISVLFIQEVVFVPVASALTGAHRDCLGLASDAQYSQKYSILCLDLP